MKSRTAWGSAGFPSEERWFNSNTTALCRRYHRGAFIERFDVATIWNITNSTALLNGIASARAAASSHASDPGPARRSLRSCATQEVGPSPNACGIFGVRSTTVRDRGCTPPHQASQNLIPRVFWMTCRKTARDDIVAVLRGRERLPIGANRKTARAAIGRSELMAPNDAGELFRRQY